MIAVAEHATLVGSSDRAVLEAAAGEERAVVTNNIRDFRPLAAEWLAQGRTHPGLIPLPSSRTRARTAIPALAAAIESVVRANPNDLAGSERWVGPLADV